MDIAPLSVTHTLTLELLDASGTETQLEAELRYDNHDPYAVSACFDTGVTSVRWVFGRSLLRGGVFRPTGDGDVHVWPCLDSAGRAVTILELTSPDGEAIMQAQSEDVCAFLRRTEDIVPMGSETLHVDIEKAIADLLG
ncbi:MAG: SsgA family sporulation/cell division regulator [Nocardioidaceae bacterium]